MVMDPSLLLLQEAFVVVPAMVKAAGAVMVKEAVAVQPAASVTVTL